MDIEKELKGENSMNSGDKIIVYSPEEGCCEAIFVSKATNPNLLKVKIIDEPYNRHAFVNKNNVVRIIEQKI